MQGLATLEGPTHQKREWKPLSSSRFPFLLRTKAGWRETLPDCVCVSLELKNDDKAQELIGPLPASNGIATHSP